MHAMTTNSFHNYMYCTMSLTSSFVLLFNGDSPSPASAYSACTDLYNLVHVQPYINVKSLLLLR